MQTKFWSNSALPAWLKSPKLVGTALIGLLATIGLGVYTTGAINRTPGSAASPSPSPVVLPKPTSVTALGRLEPQGEVIRIAAPTEGSRVAQLLVRQGERVKPGQVIAILDSRDRLQAAVLRAQEQVRLARAKLIQIRAGAKQGEINAQAAEIARLRADGQGNIAAQEAKIARLKAELANAQTDYERNQALFEDGAISASQRDSSRLARDVAQRSLEEAKLTLTRSRANLNEELNKARSTLSRIAEVRPVDVQVLEMELRNSVAAVAQALADLELAYIRAPQAGQVLKVHTWAGEVVGTEGIVEIGRTGQMFVVAQVYESDIKRVRTGQTATISSDAFEGRLQGQVADVGLQIFKQDVLDTDPTAAADARVVEVKIRLNSESSQRVASLTNLEVTVKIATGK
jgi:HlyD family secretion protein